MERRNKIILYSIIVLTIMVLGLGINSLLKRKSNAIPDANVFRMEYMSYNDKVDESDNAYRDLIISENNLINYINTDEAIKMLQEETGVIYFGYAANADCRSLIPSLLKVSSALEEPIYYLDIESIRPTYEFIDGNITKTRDGEENYNHLLELLDDYLDNNLIYDAEGHSMATFEKVLEAPTLVAFREGKITSFYTPKNYENEKIDEEILENLIESLIRSKNNIEDCAQNGC